MQTAPINISLGAYIHGISFRTLLSIFGSFSKVSIGIVEKLLAAILLPVRFRMDTHPPKQKLTENSNFLFKNLRNFRKLKTLNQIPYFLNFRQNLSDFGISLLFKDGNYYSKTERKELQTVHQYILRLLNKLLVSKITNPGRVHLARKLS